MSALSARYDFPYDFKGGAYGAAGACGHGDARRFDALAEQRQGGPAGGGTRPPFSAPRATHGAGARRALPPKNDCAWCGPSLGPYRPRICRFFASNSSAVIKPSSRSSASLRI